MIMSEGISRTKMKASEFRFTRVKGWLGGDQTERIEGWKTYIYEAAGKMKAVNTTKVCMTGSLINLPCALRLSCITAVWHNCRTQGVRAALLVHSICKLWAYHTG